MKSIRGPKHPPTRGTREAGQSLVEFAIVLTIFLMLIAGIVDFGRGFNAWIVLSTAAREGVRQASVGKSGADVAAAARAFALVPGVDPATVDVNITYSSSPPQTGDSVEVQVVTNEFPIATPWVAAAFRAGGLCGDPCTISISSAATMRYEGIYIE